MEYPPQVTQPFGAPAANSFEHSTYVLRRKFFQFFGAAFHIYDPAGNVAFYSKQKAFKLKEDIRVYSGEDMSHELLVIQARSMLDFSASYDVFDPINRAKVGALRRRGFASIVRDAWQILDPYDQQIGEIREDSVTLALIRRFLTNLVPQTFVGSVHGQTVFHFKQHFNPFVQKITLDFTPDVNFALDRRLGLAAAVLLCAIEGRQSGG